MRNTQQIKVQVNMLDEKDSRTTESNMEAAELLCTFFKKSLSRMLKTTGIIMELLHNQDMRIMRDVSVLIQSLKIKKFEMW